MTTDDAQRERALRFRALHYGDKPLRLANAWDATSARVLTAAGASAIGTTSFGVALDHGTQDGERLPFDRVLEVTHSIVSAVGVPVTIDMEAGHGATPGEVQQSVGRVIECGAVGINIEDSIPGQPGALLDAPGQSARIAAARAAAEQSGVPLFINARCDVYFGADIPSDMRVSEVLSRARSYQAAGADGLFLPGLLDPATIKILSSQIDLPVNIMIGVGAPSFAELADAGVRRLSQGGEPFLTVAGFLKTLTERYLAGQFSPYPEALSAGVTLIQALVG
jgi:2-methylisocitrate lyase-like PEP mutase family enzyme